MSYLAASVAVMLSAFALAVFCFVRFVREELS